MKMLLILYFLIRKEDIDVAFFWRFSTEKGFKCYAASPPLPPPPPQTFADISGKTSIGMNHPDGQRSCTLISLSNQQVITAALGLRKQGNDQQELWFSALVSLFTELEISFVSVDLIWVIAILTPLFYNNLIAEHRDTVLHLKLTFANVFVRPFIKIPLILFYFIL